MEQKNIECLNCGARLDGNFCSSCGQSAKVSRFTLKHVFGRDFLRGIFHIDKGILFTVKELFTRPGHSVREYVAGKRVRHFNYFSLVIVVILLFSLVEDITPFHRADLSEEGKEIVKSVEETVKAHPKWVYVGIIPVYAIISYLFFRKAKQNYAEHLVINAFRGSATQILNILFITIASFLHDIPTLIRMERVLVWTILGYGTWFYYQYFSPFYTHKGLLVFRSLLCAAVPFILIAVVLLIYITSISTDPG